MTRFDEVDVDPAVRRWMKRTTELTAALPGFSSPAIAERRAAALRLSNALAGEFTLPVPRGVRIEEDEVAGSTGVLRARRYRAEGIATLAPTQLFLHGGGFWAGTTEEAINDRILARRAVETGIQFFSLEYRLAPEHPFPAAVQDAAAALHALAGDRRVDAARLGIGGNSAGAAIAALAAVAVRDEGGPALIHQDLEVLPGALRAVGESAEAYAQGFGLDDASGLAEIYLGTSDVPAGAEPLSVADLAGLPPALIMVAEFDPLRDSGIAYARRLEQANIPVDLVVGAGHLHGSVGLTAAMPAALEWQRIHTRALIEAYGPRE